MTTTGTRDIIDRIFKEPGIKYELTEFEALGKRIHEILDICAKAVETGRDAGKTKYFLQSIVPFSSGKEEVQVYVDGGKSAPEEIVHYSGRRPTSAPSSVSSNKPHGGSDPRRGPPSDRKA
jgi:hypothetical protein